MQKAVEGARWIDFMHYGFLVVDVERTAATATWWWVDPEDHTSTEIGRTWRVLGGERARLIDAEERPELTARRPRWRAVAAAVTAAALVALVVRRLRASGPIRLPRIGDP